MGHYGHKSIPDAKFESGSSFSFGDMTSQNFGDMTSSNSTIYSRKTGSALKKISFYVQNRSSRPKIDPHVNFSNFQVEENFSHVSMRKEQQQPP